MFVFNVVEVRKLLQRQHIRQASMKIQHSHLKWIFVFTVLNAPQGKHAQDSMHVCKTEGGKIDSSASWNFNHSPQGWTTAPEYDHRWTHISGLINGYMALNVHDGKTTSHSRLLSPWLCPTGDNQYSLTFRFYYGSAARCQLKLFLVTDLNALCLTWTGTADTTGVFYSLSRPLIVNSLPCRRNKFQIIFEGQKLQNKSCGDVFDEIAVDDIEYKYVSSIRPSPTLPSNGSATTMSQGNADVTNKSERNYQLLSTGSIVAVVVIVVVVIVAFIIVIVIVLFKRKQRSVCTVQKEMLPNESQTPHGSTFGQTETDVIYPINATNDMQITVENSLSHNMEHSGEWDITSLLMDHTLANIYEGYATIKQNLFGASVNIDYSTAQYYNIRQTATSARTQTPKQDINITDIYEDTD